MAKLVLPGCTLPLSTHKDLNSDMRSCSKWLSSLNEMMLFAQSKERSTLAVCKLTPAAACSNLSPWSACTPCCVLLDHTVNARSNPIGQCVGQFKCWIVRLQISLQQQHVVLLTCCPSRHPTPIKSTMTENDSKEVQCQ